MLTKEEVCATRKMAADGLSYQEIAHVILEWRMTHLLKRVTEEVQRYLEDRKDGVE